MSEHICEVWCSPSRHEFYKINYIYTGNDELEICKEDDIKAFYLCTFGNFWFDVFGINWANVQGLWKVVVKIEVTYTNTHDWEGIPDGDTEFESEVLFKGQCESFSELRWKWKEIKDSWSKIK